MRNIEINLAADNAKGLSALLSPMGSVAMSVQQAGRLLKAVLHDDICVVEKVCDEILKVLVPEEGNPDPKRASYEMLEDGVELCTPGGVHISIVAANGKAKIVLDFGRDSVFLAASVVACYCIATRKPFVAIPVNVGWNGITM